MTGNLRDSARIQISANKRGKPTAFGLVGWRAPRGGGVPRVPQFLGVEFGSKRNKKPVHVIENAFERNKGKVVATFSREFPKQFDRTLKRLNKKFGRGKTRVT